MSSRDVLDPSLTMRDGIQRVPLELIDAAKKFPTATLHEAAGKIGALPSLIKPTAPNFRISGPAITVHCPGGDNLWIHRAIYAAKPGDVLVVYTNDHYEHGYWGEIMSTAAQVRGLGGLVIDACVRDGDLLAEIGLPVFARGLCIRGTGKDFGARGWVNAPIMFGGVIVAPGDLVVGDSDGVVCIPRARVAAVVNNAREREKKEAEILQQLRAGATTLELYGWQ